MKSEVNSSKATLKSHVFVSLQCLRIFIIILMCIFISSMDSKPINIRWIKTGSQPY